MTSRKAYAARGSAQATSGRKIRLWGPQLALYSCSLRTWSSVLGILRCTLPMGELGKVEAGPAPAHISGRWLLPSFPSSRHLPARTLVTSKNIIWGDSRKAGRLKKGGRACPGCRRIAESSSSSSKRISTTMFVNVYIFLNLKIYN